MPRAITFLALLQTMLIVAGFCALGIVLKISGYPAVEHVRWNPLAVALREHGMWLLLLPVLWVVFATMARRIDRGFFSDRSAYILGATLSCLIIGMFLYACVAPGTWSSLIIKIR